MRQPACKDPPVLVVDDDPAVRDALKFALETEGMNVETYANGRQLLHSENLGRASCLVLDCQMPDLDGFAIVAELAARKMTLPVILMTAPVTEAMRRRAEKAGVFNLLEKPLLNGVLTDSIRRATGA
jgi:FixJ family two-component response regulator